jgi:hypothetical protein
LSKIKTIGARLSKARSLFVVLGWGLSLTSLTLAAITSAVLVPHAGVESFQLLGVVLYYAGVFAISLLSGLLLRSLTVAVPGTFVAYMLGLVLTGLVLDLPGIVGILPEGIAENSALVFTFTALFPFPLLVALVAGVLGAAITEI